MLASKVAFWKFQVCRSKNKFLEGLKVPVIFNKFLRGISDGVLGYIQERFHKNNCSLEHTETWTAASHKDVCFKITTLNTLFL